MRPLLALVAVALLIAGCGYKTPLVLPKPKPVEKPSEKAAAQKPAAADNEKKPENEP